MRQLLQNLVGNALKFHRPEVQTLIRIDATFSEEPAPGGELRKMVQLSVADNGIGFDEKYTERIFQVFQRLHTRAAYEGTGMGLAISRKIAEHHGGSITAQSKLGEGSTFLVKLPLAQRKAD
jgi:signal transduction histidine kinase